MGSKADWANLRRIFLGRHRGALWIVLSVGIVGAVLSFSGVTEVSPEVFSVIAGVIPVLVLAYVVEARGHYGEVEQLRMGAIRDAKNDHRRTRRLIEKIAEMDEPHASILKEKLVEIGDGEVLSEKQSKDRIERSRGVFNLARNQIKSTNKAAGAIAGFGEIVALACVAASSTSIWFFLLLLANVLALGVVIAAVMADRLWTIEQISDWADDADLEDY